MATLSLSGYLWSLTNLKKSKADTENHLFNKARIMDMSTIKLLAINFSIKDSIAMGQACQMCQWSNQ